ncbi:PREDICTED: uncharacterized protein LOC108564831 [Nicrophorus vespilloides]|uniref:Uncharacterized protein LOC108564831 n=1 Tax=Nicrophorus vespilloides TaxID=110193 RepID=A0ABM1MY27_NICVS|nr:PREDICTED: uncharacterized protein LOC108564831 [Nicrophorus vespilloides]
MEEIYWYKSINIFETENHWQRYLMELKQMSLQISDVEDDMKKESCKHRNELKKLHLFLKQLLKIIQDKTFQKKCKRLLNNINMSIAKEYENPTRNILIKINEQITVLYPHSKFSDSPFEKKIREYHVELKRCALPENMNASRCQDVATNILNLTELIYADLKKYTRKFDEIEEVFETTVLYPNPPPDMEKNIVRMVEICKEMRQMREDLKEDMFAGFMFFLKSESFQLEFAKMLQQNKLFVLTDDESSVVEVMRAVDDTCNRLMPQDAFMNVRKKVRPESENCLTDLWNRMRLIKGLSTSIP